MENSGVSRHMLDHARLATLYIRNGVSVIFGARINVHSFIYCRCQICLGCLLGEVGARDFDLQARLVGC